MIRKIDVLEKYGIILHVFTETIINEQDLIQDQFVKQSATGLNSEFFLHLDWLPNDGLKKQICSTINHCLKEKR